MNIFVVRTGFNDFKSHDSLGRMEMNKRSEILRRECARSSGARVHILSATAPDAVLSGLIVKTAFGLDTLTLADWLDEDHMPNAYPGLQQFIAQNRGAGHIIAVTHLTQMHWLLVRIASEIRLKFFFNDVRTMYAVDQETRTIRALSPAW